MQTIIESHTISEHGSHYITATCGKKTAEVAISELYVCVRVNNAMQRAYGSLGRVFHGGISEAIEGYKSGEIKAILIAAHSAATCGLQLVA
jgi:hypothetical protein